MIFSLICACNDRALFEECVGASLAVQRERSFELLLVDTCAKRYSSAAAALNEGAARAQGEYLVFLHQDVCFGDADFLAKLRGLLSGREFAVAGVAGALRGRFWWRTSTRTNIVHGADRRRPGKSMRIPGGEPLPCQTVDECLFVIPRALFARRGFREYLPTWHLYAAEYCLWALAEGKGPVLALPLELWHRSAAKSFNLNYFDAIDAVRREYRRSVNVIYTTMAAWPTNGLLFRLKKFYRLFKFHRAQARRKP